MMDDSAALPEVPETGPQASIDDAENTPLDALHEQAVEWTLKAMVRVGQIMVASTDGRVLREGGQGQQALAMAWGTLTGALAKPAPAPAGPERVPTTDAAVGMAHQAMVDHAQKDPQGFADAMANDPNYVPELLSGAQAHIGDLEGAGSPQAGTDGPSAD